MADSATSASLHRTKCQSLIDSVDLLRRARPISQREEKQLAKKERTIRPWTATDFRMLKGLAKQKVGVAKISKSLKRTVGAVTMMASKKGISLSTRD